MEMVVVVDMTEMVVVVVVMTEVVVVVCAFL